MGLVSRVGLSLVAIVGLIIFPGLRPAVASSHPTTVVELEIALCLGGGDVVALGAEIAQSGNVLTIGADCDAVLDLNGQTLTVQRVVITDGSKLTIRDSSGPANGRLVAVPPSTPNVAGIQTTGAVLAIEGGTVASTGGEGSAGIGGSDGGAGGTVEISGGTVIATGRINGAGIGGGQFGAGGTVTISGGTVTATGGSSSAGIGGGKEGDAATVHISGGTVTVTGGSSGAGIGGGDGKAGGTVTVSGGTVTATGGTDATAIGRGRVLGAPLSMGMLTLGEFAVRVDEGLTTTITFVFPDPPEQRTVPTIALSCVTGSLDVGDLVVCTITGGDAGIDVLWRASFNPVFAGAGVTLDDSGTGEFSFEVPAAALGETMTVELVEWLAPVSFGVVSGPVPMSVPTGEGPLPTPVPVWPLVAVVMALAGGLTLRGEPRPGWPALRVG